MFRKSCFLVRGQFRELFISVCVVYEVRGLVFDLNSVHCMYVFAAVHRPGEKDESRWVPAFSIAVPQRTSTSAEESASGIVPRASGSSTLRLGCTSCRTRTCPIGDDLISQCVLTTS